MATGPFEPAVFTWSWDMLTRDMAILVAWYGSTLPLLALLPFMCIRSHKLDKGPQTVPRSAVPGVIMTASAIAIAAFVLFRLSQF